ncbi:hypothetical protein GCM10010255_21340 [Streptomyces coeruleofuscus]|uniref:Uncharacterized protein n=1 Tax=Streptomyces coeruleofuscus TaxID=66879 RepID=A0ABN3I053_9ACTN
MTRHRWVDVETVAYIDGAVTGVLDLDDVAPHGGFDDLLRGEPLLLAMPHRLT